MEHRHLNHDRLTPAAIDDIIQRGRLADWTRLAQALQADSSGSLRQLVHHICIARGRDPEAPSQSYTFWTSYLRIHGYA